MAEMKTLTIGETTYEIVDEKARNEKLNASALPTAINTALAQAKASGEFDGKDGKNGSNGKDGTSATHSWNGTVLTVTSASGTSSADLKGETGNQGIQGERGLAMYTVDSNLVSSADTFPFASFNIPDGYTPKINDIVLYKNGQLATIMEVNTDNQTAMVGATDTSIAGASISVKSVSESTADGGSNIVTFSDGKILYIKNGKTGSTGAQGEPGKDGANGKDGVSVTITNVAESTASGGYNTVIFSDGNTLRIQNGTKGDKGDKGDTGATGATGKTPVKGVDYWTEVDQESIVQDVIRALGTPVFGRVDADNNIILTGELADGTYVLKYEDAEGNVTEVGQIDLGASYTNQIPLSINSDGTPYNGGQGWKTGYRLNSSGAETTKDGMEVTGFISAKYGDTIYLDGVDYNYTDANSAYRDNTYLSYYDSSFAFLGYRKPYDRDMANVTEFVLNDASQPGLAAYTGSNAQNVAYFRISSGHIDANSIITVNQPIE